ncbi:hypothetical protein RND81_08G073600 [Saponaria officinalis]|uniref:Uncharacterized protein n=1 Tax=Saponaria officinalis TaxID=3572 RepID=A0AAW1J5H8_SAPOF
MGIIGIEYPAQQRLMYIRVGSGSGRVNSGFGSYSSFTIRVNFGSRVRLFGSGQTGRVSFARSTNNDVEIKQQMIIGQTRPRHDEPSAGIQKSDTTQHSTTGLRMSEVKLVDQAKPRFSSTHRYENNHKFFTLKKTREAKICIQGSTNVIMLCKKYQYHYTIPSN